MQESQLYCLYLEDHVPREHLLRSIDRFVDLRGIRGIFGLITASPGGHRSIPN